MANDLYADRRDKVVVAANKAADLPTSSSELGSRMTIAVVQALLLVADEVHQLRVALRRPTVEE